MTVTSSEIASTSESLCVMMTMVLPCSRMRRRMAKNSSTSCGVSTAVGSSRMRSARLPIERLEQLDALLLAHREVLDAGRGIDRQLQLFREGADARLGGLQVEGEGGAGLDPQDDVLGHRHRLDQHEVLVDHADAEGDGVVGARDAAHLAVDQHVARVGRVEAVGDAHGGRLAGAVLADEGVDGARLDLEVDAVVRQDAAEALGDVAKLQHALRHCAYCAIASVTLISPAMILALAASTSAITSLGMSFSLYSSMA